MREDKNNIVRNYVNHGFFTISSCQCNIEFRNCLAELGFYGQLLYNFYREVMQADCIESSDGFQMIRGKMPTLTYDQTPPTSGVLMLKVISMFLLFNIFLLQPF